MKTLKVTTYNQVPVEIESPIEKVVHGLPTWMFPTSYGGGKTIRCPVCNLEIALNIAHGYYIATCSFIQTKSGLISPIHTACYESIGTDEKVNHFNQSGHILDEIILTPPQ